MTRRAAPVRTRQLLQRNSEETGGNVSGELGEKSGVLRCRGMYAQKFIVEVLIRGQRRACPLEWLDQFCMRNFTNSADFDDTLPMGEGRIEASFRLTPERFAEGLGAWLTQRGKGEGEAVKVEVRRENA